MIGTVAALAAAAAVAAGAGTAAVVLEDTGASSPELTAQAAGAPSVQPLSTGTGQYSATFHWAGVNEPSQTGYYVYQDGTQVADVANPTYTFTGLDCGTTFTFGVAAHDASGATSPPETTSYSTAACPGGGGGGGTPVFCNNAAAYNNLTTGPHLCGWPDSTNTGYTHAPGYPGSLTTASSGSSTCPTVPLSNHTYSYCDYVGGLPLPANLQNTTFYGSAFEANAPNNPNVGRGGSGATINNITFSYDTFKPLISAPPVSCADSYQYGIYNEGGIIGKLTVAHSDFWGFGNAIDTTGSTQANPQIFKDNWFHDSVVSGTPSCGYHNDGIGMLNGGTQSYSIVNHNTIQFLGNTNLIAWQDGNYDHDQNTNNLLSGDNQSYAGGRCTTVCTAQPTFIQTTGNTLNTYFCLAYNESVGHCDSTGGPLDGATAYWTHTGSSWNHNYWAVPSGAQWGTPAYNGLFWVPTGDSQWPNDCGFVSTTDYPTITHPSGTGC